MNNNKPRIAYLVSLYPAVSHTFVLREVLGLKKMGFEIATASINSLDKAHTDLTKDETEEYKNTFYIKEQGLLGALSAFIRTLITHPIGLFKGLWTSIKLGGFHPKRFLYGIAYFFEALILGNWITSKKINHVHVHFINPATSVGLIASKIFPITYSFTSHGSDEFYDVKGQNVLEKILGAKFAVSISNYNQSQLMRIAPHSEWNKFNVIRLGVDPIHFSQKTQNKLNGIFEILCVGRLAPSKGQLILVDAVNALVKEGLPLRLRLIGNGPDWDLLKKKENNHILLEGTVNQDKIHQFYSQADLFVLSSFAEGLPIVLMEAMSIEIPCISTFVNGIPELIENNVDGLLIAPSSIEELRNAIRELYNNKGLRTQIAKKGREKILQKYDLGQNLKKLAALFERELQNVNSK